MHGSQTLHAQYIAVSRNSRVRVCRAPDARRALPRCAAQHATPTDLSAVVVGSGFAGLAAAAGLSKRFKHVVSIRMLRYWSAAREPVYKRLLLQTLLERDSVPFHIAPEETSEPETGRQQYEV